jgi:glycerol kinase
MPERFVIALDQGTTTSRAILVDRKVFEGKYIVK